MAVTCFVRTLLDTSHGTAWAQLAPKPLGANSVITYDHVHGCSKRCGLLTTIMQQAASRSFSLALKETAMCRESGAFSTARGGALRTGQRKLHLQSLKPIV